MNCWLWSKMSNGTCSFPNALTGTPLNLFASAWSSWGSHITWEPQIPTRLSMHAHLTNNYCCQTFWSASHNDTPKVFQVVWNCQKSAGNTLHAFWWKHLFFTQESMEQATCCMLGCIYMYKPCYIMYYIVYTVKSQNISSTIISFISAYIWHKAIKYKHTKCSILAHCKKHPTISTLA